MDGCWYDNPTTLKREYIENGQVVLAICLSSLRNDLGSGSKLLQELAKIPWKPRQQFTM